MTHLSAARWREFRTLRVTWVIKCLNSLVYPWRDKYFLLTDENYLQTLKLHAPVVNKYITGVPRIHG
jgi:hypothetical protein